MKQRGLSDEEKTLVDQGVLIGMKVAELSIMLGRSYNIVYNYYNKCNVQLEDSEQK